ncbi:hypothetical protein KBC04_01930 [Candidatus Babeliales bacterium]|nr:hypothetical protein [Candidatus Babeliales bacterium]MBP9843832.1 hypothetical protein [Candidatus Babeliales bacterium]
MKKQFLVISMLITAMTAGLTHASSNPTMSRVYGNQFTPQVASSQSAAAVGSLDALFDGDGSLSVNSVLAGGQAVGVETLSNGNFLVVVSHDAATTDAVVAQYNAEGALFDGTAASPAYGTLGIADLGAVVTPRATMIDAQGRLLVAGGDTSGTAGWIKRVSTDGDTVTSFSTGTSWQFVGGLAQQSTGKIIAVGFDGTYAQIGRYNLDGSLDTSFASSGFVVLNNFMTLVTSTNGLYSVVVDTSTNYIYILYNDTVAAHVQFLVLDATGAYSTVSTISYLDGATPSSLKLACNQDNNMIFAGEVSGAILVTAREKVGGGTPAGWTNFSSDTAAGIPHDNYILNDILVSSGSTYGYIYLVGSDTTTTDMAVIRLGAHSGAVDTAFNTTGYNFFAVGTPDTTSTLQAAGLALDGQLYVPGYQVNTGTTVPYISRLNSTQYAYEIAQFPAGQEQGILDVAFGSEATQTYSGVVSPFNGKYGSSLQQRAQQAIEITTTPGAAAGIPPVGDILIGMNGFTNSSPSSNMMFAWLTSVGDIDTTINTTGYRTLDNTSSSFEYLTQVLQGPSGVVFVSGYASATAGGVSTQAFVRTYTTPWSSGTESSTGSQATANWQGVGVGYQSSTTNTLLFVAESSTVGHISAYTGSSLATWGDTASGTIDSTSYSLNMGPVYNGGLVNATDNLIVAYKDSSDNTVRAVMFLPDGSGLQTLFGQGTVAGTSVALFAGATTIAANNIRTCFNSNGDILVSAINGAGTSLLFTLLSGETGDVDTNFGTAGLLTVAITGSTSLQLKDIIGVSDGTAIATFYDNATDDTMYLARIITVGGAGVAGSLDTTFNSQGSQQGVLSFQVGDRVANYDARVATSALVQSTESANQGNIVVSAYESVTSNDATPMVVRSFGTADTTQVMSYPITNTGVPGTFDVAYDLVTDLGASAAKVVYTYPAGNTHEGYSLIGYDNGTTSLVARYDISTNVLDATFGTAGIYTIAGSLVGISTLSIDSKNRIIVGGTDTGVAWAQQIEENGASAVSFGTFPTGMNSINQIAEQTSGRYIVAGDTTTRVGNFGILVAFQSELVSPALTLAIDPTFNPLAAGTVSAAGHYSLTPSGSTIYSFAINADDTILAVYKDATSGFLSVAEITANGSGLVPGFNSGAILTTAITPDNGAVCRVAISSSSAAVVVAASTGTGANVKLQRFLADGSTDVSWNGTGAILTVSNLGSAGITLSDLMETTSNQTVFLGYNTAGGNGKLFAARVSSAGILDVTWNPSSSLPDTDGVLTFDTNSVTQMNGSSMTIDGEIIAVGQQATGTAGDPIVMYIYGDTFVTQTSQAPLADAAGVLDLTIPGGSSGAWALSGTITGVPAKIAIYGGSNTSNGAMMIASSNGTNSYVTKLNADLTVGTYGTSGVATLTGLDTINDMYLVGSINSDTLAPIYVTGSDATGGAHMWGANISTDGTTITYLANAGGMTTGNVIRQTNNGRILVAGYHGDSASGAIAAFGAVTSGGVYPLDLSFGNNADSSPNYGGGVYATGVATQIYDMAIDSFDRIYIAYKSGSAIAVQRLLANGTALDTTFGTAGTATFTTAVNSYSASQIRLALDMTNSRLVVAAQDGTSTSNIIQVCRYDLSGVAKGEISTVTIASKVLNLSDLFIDAAQNIYVNGYNSTDSLAVVARIASTSATVITLDTANYAIAGGTPGIANVDTGSMTGVIAGAYDPDKRTYLVGSDGGGVNGYMARLYGDIYTSEVSEAIATATVGSIDTSLQPNNTGAIDLSGQTGWAGLSGYTAKAVLVNPNNDGTAFIAFGDGTDVIVGKVNADMTPVTAFGTAGLTGGYTLPTINSIDLDSDSNIIVGGANAGAQKVISFTSAGVLNAYFATTVSSTVASNVVQQKSGRYIVAGYDGSANGLIIAYQNQSAISATTLPVDQTFGPAGSNGFYATGVNAPIDDLCIDSNDNIYFTYTLSNVVYLGKLTANGSGLVNDVNSSVAFNSGAVVTTNLTGVAGSRIAINSAGNILVGNATTAGTIVQTQLFDGSTGASMQTVPTTPTNIFTGTAPVLTKLVGSGTEFYGVLYDTTPNMTVFAISGTAGALDGNFGTSGITTSTVGSPAAMYGLSIQADGKLVTVGVSSTPRPLLMRFNGFEYVPQYAQAPDRVAAGQLDTTLWPADSGAFPLTTAHIPGLPDLSGYSVSRVYEAGNGVMTFVADNSGDTVVFQLLKDLTLNTAFSGDGYRTFATNYGATTGLYVDTLGNIFICGTNSGASWVIGMDSAGADLSPAFAPTSDLTAGYAVSQQGNARVILAGLGATNGTLKGYNNTGALDVTFATTGTLDVGGALAVTDIAIDAYDRIITVQNNAGTVVLKRVTASGLASGAVSAVTTSAGTAISTAVSGSNIKAVLDNGGRIVVAAATSTGYVLRSYNNDATMTVIGAGPVTIAPAGSTFILSNIYATNDNKITLVGYESVAGNVVVARFTSNGAGLTLDTASFNASTGYLLTTIGSLDQANDAIIHADDRIMVVGSNAAAANPYMGRVFGYPYATYTAQGPTEGVAGTINPAFGNTVPTTGTYDVSTLNAVLVGAQGKAILPLADGGYYMALDNANTAANSVLVKTLSSGMLDTSYNTTGIATTYAPLGVNSILEDGSSNVVLVGTTGGAGWVKRYTSAGVLDGTFNTNIDAALTSLSTPDVATVAIEQTLARLVVAGSDDTGKAALFAFQSLSPNGNPGALDTTFNSTGTIAGQYSTAVTGTIYSVIADQYDRLIFSVLNAGAVDLYRLTPTGELDITFGTDGVVAGAITSAAGASYVALDQAGNIIVASNSSTADTFSVAAFDNGVLTTTGGNGLAVYAQLNISSLTGPTVTNLITSADGYALVVGNIATSGWIARITGGGALDTSFNPAAIGGVQGIYKYARSTLVPHLFYGLAVNADGTLGMLGYQDNTTDVPLLVSVYDDPYTSQQAQSPDSKAVGTIDATLGAGSSNVVTDGIKFFGASGNAASLQTARALALYDDNNIVVAIDGNSAIGAGTSEIMINMFDNDGIANPTFGTAGSEIALSNYENQYVRDMVTFTTVAGVHKAILAGYVENSTLGTSDSLLLQYVLTPGASGLDTSFGGFDGNPSGVAFGDGQALYSVAQQSNGRIIAAGLTQGTLTGLLLGYTANGKMDNSFANNGYQSVDTGSTGIYTHAVDTNNNIVFAYNSANTVVVARYLADGSALDSTFTASTAIATISGNTNMKVAVDSSNNVYAAGVIASGNSIMVKIYAAASGTESDTKTLTGTALGNASAVYTLGRLLVDAAGNTIIAAYDSNAQQIVVVRLTTALELDTTFNSTGYIAYAVAGGTSSQIATDAMIHPDGRILVSGSEA